MQKEQQELANLIKGKKVAFIGAGVSHKTLIREFVELICRTFSGCCLT